MSRLFPVSTRKIKTVNFKSFLAFSIWVGLLLNLREIEPTVSYELFFTKRNACNYCFVEELVYLYLLCTSQAKRLTKGFLASKSTDSRSAGSVGGSYLRHHAKIATFVHRRPLALRLA